MSTIRVYNRSSDNDSLTKNAIVLDIDSTLLHTQTSLSTLYKSGVLTDPGQLQLRNEIYYLNVDEEYGLSNSQIYKMWGVKRPYLDDFLRFCFEYFRYVFVWSAGTPPYVNSVVQTLFLPLNLKPHAILNRTDCVILPDHTTYKPLENLYNRTNPNPINKSFQVGPTNTLALDDNASTFVYNNNNGIHIPEFTIQPSIINMNRKVKSDKVLVQLMYWLSKENVMKTDDVRKLSKKDIFTTDIDEYAKHYRQVGTIDLNKL